MGFFTPVSPDRLGCKPAEAFRQPQVCPPKTSKNFRFRPGKRDENHHRKRAPPSP